MMQYPPISCRPVRVATVTFYTPWAYLRRTGRIAEGEIAYDDVTPGRKRPPTIKVIQAHVASYFGTRVAEMTSNRRSRDVARPRQVAMYLSKQLTPQSLPEIGRRFGNRDHTTVIHAIRQVTRLCSEDPEMERDVAILLEELGNIE